MTTFLTFLVIGLVFLLKAAVGLVALILIGYALMMVVWAIMGFVFWLTVVLVTRGHVR